MATLIPVSVAASCRLFPDLWIAAFSDSLRGFVFLMEFIQ